MQYEFSGCYYVYMSDLRSFENFAKIYARLAKLLSFEERNTQTLASRRMTS